ncbi:hypothetical protein B0A55_00574 [Friedmanniomyces simplex]|uniref:Sulfatase N-terminal domain-containing protein n=1 Tax=Friedmanniomyces simplex TaxID=329884 RepID=A0A4U0Y213_9PEZI|nr:hypothetical protein B0A55_00574 [Friedmanniomyces simplex]
MVRGYPKFASQGFNSAYLPIWLQDVGYNTYYVGKLFNAQTVDNYDSPHAAGWTGSDFLLDPYTYEYLNATFQRNHDLPVSYEGRYGADVVAEKAYGFLNDGLRSAAEKPFFLVIAPTAPHSNVHINENLIDGNFSEKSVIQSPPVSADRHKHLFPDAKVPRTKHFNPEEPNSVSWISRLPKQNETNIEFNDHFYRSRLRALQSVDEMIDGVVSRLTEAGVLENTFIFYTTDNGYHIGQHRLQPGKQCAFEEDINIPLVVRGPKIPEGLTSDIVTTHTDLAPTLMKLAGAALRSDFDGTAIPLTVPELQAAVETRQEHVNVEMWGIIMSEGRYGSVLYPNHTYKALRLIGEDYSFLYTVWCSGEHELYDLVVDPYETHNLVAHDVSGSLVFASSSSDLAEGQATVDFPSTSGSTAHTANNHTHSTKDASVGRVVARLDSLLMVLKTCKARECTHPWEVLHPAGNVHDLHDALSAEFDDFYETQQQRVQFSKCEKGYIAESEGPNGVVAWTVEDVGVRGGANWQDLAGIRCCPSNPNCQYIAVSEAWQINRPIDDKGHGTWRERRGLHNFVHFTNAPARAGLFRSAFWHDTVLKACLYDPVLYHLGSGLGVLHEFVLRRNNGEGSEDSDSVPFALRQCNRAIAGLAGGDCGQRNSEVALVACILFVFFESLQGRTSEAIPHCVQGRNLLARIEQSTLKGGFTGLVDPVAARPVIDGLELQARCVPGISTYRNLITDFRDMFLPRFEALHSLDHANATLQAALNSILLAGVDFNQRIRLRDVRKAMAERQSRFLPWLDHWNTRFADLLAQHDTDDDEKWPLRSTQKIQILQVNALVARIMATIDLTRAPSPWAEYAAELRTILRLSSAVLDAHGFGINPTLSEVRFPFLMLGLWVGEGLYYAMARSPEYEVQKRAAQILLAHPCSKARAKGGGGGGGGLEAGTTAEWSVEDWIGFASSAPLHQGTAVLFGGFQPLMAFV